MRTANPDYVLEWAEIFPTRTIAPDELPDGDLPRAIRVLKYLRRRLAELGEPWAPVEIKDIHDPLGVAISNLWMLGWVRLAVAYDDAGKAYTICQPAGHAQDDKPLLN